MADTKTIPLIAGMVILLALVGTTYYITNLNQTYYCEKLNIVSMCFKLSSATNGISSRCYYNETTPTKYYTCASGWKPIKNFPGIMNNLTITGHDIVKQVNYAKLTEGYPEITLKDKSGNSILDTKLNSITPLCPNGKCNAEQIFNNYQNVSAVDDVRFKDRNGNEIMVPYSLYTYETEKYIDQEIASNFKCIDNSEKNGTICYSIDTYKNVTKTRMIQVPYVLGDRFLGTKVIGINAKIDGFADYVFISNGVWLDEMGTWTSANCMIGGNITIDGDYCVNTFINNGTMNFTTAVNNVTILVVGAGGGGAGQNGGGGGGGGTNYSSMNVEAKKYYIVVGTGGFGGGYSGDYFFPTRGSNSSFGGIINVTGGGGGMMGRGHAATQERNGSSGGGNGNDQVIGSIGYSIVGYGYNGGHMGGGGATSSQGGGGGAGSIGISPADATYAGHGGYGKNYTINGTNLCYGGGGGGSSRGTGLTGSGLCGGGNGEDDAGPNGINGTVNMGGGGGGGGYPYFGGFGGTGIVIIRYPLLLSKQILGVVVTSSGVNISNATVYILSSNGTLLGATSSAVDSGNWTISITASAIEVTNMTVVGFNPYNISQGGNAYPFISA